MKKIISLLLSILMLLSMSAGLDFSAFADEQDASTPVAADTATPDKPTVTYSYDEESATLTISGKGEMKLKEDNGEMPWKSYANSILNLIVEDGITSIQNSAFYGMTSLMSVTLPNTITTIGNYAFKRCTTLDAITIPSSVTSIGVGAFDSCELLETISIPNGVTKIESNTFDSCSELKKVQIPSTVTSIGYLAFGYCESLQSIVIPSSVLNIGEYAFEGCKALKSVTLNDGLLTIGAGAFVRDKKLASVNIPKTVKVIGDAAFYGTAIKKIVIPEGVKKIGRETFAECKNLTTVSIPASCKSVASDAFRGYYDNNNTYIPTPITSLTIGGKKTTLKPSKVNKLAVSKDGKKRSIKVSFATVKGVGGYESEYSRDKKYLGFLTAKSSAKSMTIKKRHAKSTYYVRVRTYKDVKIGKTNIRVYSKWSAYSTVKTK